MKKNFLSNILFASAVAVILWAFSAQSVFAAFPTDWQYRKSHVINPATGAGSDYQVRIIAHWDNGTDSGEDVYFDGKCQADFDDIRFVSSDGTTELDYWMETGSLTTGTTASAIFWVKVDDNLSTTAQTIYVYYGNAAETTTSDGDNAFIFFDDFDVNLAKWVKEKELSPGVITLNAASSYVRCGGGSTGGTYGHTSLGSSPAYSSFQNGAIEMRLKESSQALAEIVYRGDFAANTGYKGRYDCRTGTESPHMKPSFFGWSAFGAAVTRFGIDTDTWFRGTVAATSSGGLFTHRIFRNDVLMSTATDTEYPGPGEIALQNHYGSYADYDWVAVRKFVYPEPVDGAWGAEDPLHADVTATKSVALHTDLDANEIITSGDTLQYNVKIRNTTGNVAALGTTFTDTLPANVTYAGSETATSGSVSYIAGLNQIQWTGDVAVGVLIEITFDVTIDFAPGPLPLAFGTVVSNQGTVDYDSDNDGINDTPVSTDGNPDTAPIDTTDFTVGAPAHALGIKTAVDLDLDGDGFLEPGDTVEYTITITNKSGFIAAAPLEFVDVIPDNTTYDSGFTPTVTDFAMPPALPDPPYSDHTPIISFTDPTLTITDIDIGATPPTDNVIVIKFHVILDNPFPPGVTEISNQAKAHYDSNSDGINDTWQHTDGDTGTPGNQPTVTTVSIGTISGTVFDDNGDGGGTSGNGTQDGTEPGLFDVKVDLYDAFINLLYWTDINGGYIFTGLPSGTYTVEETVPTYYTATSPNPVVKVLTAGGSEVVNFGDQPNGNADLEISKFCGALLTDGSDQLAYLITITNNGPDDLIAADNVELTDDLDALVIAGLSNINYTEDGGALTAWPGTNTLTWASMAAGASHIIRIFATVAPTFVPAENTASVISDIYDPLPGTNSATCTNSIYTMDRGALEFNAVDNTSVSAASSPDFDFGTTGTMEAWIYPVAFPTNAGILIKGTTTACYGFGFGGGGVGDLFSGGTEQNIDFVLYDTKDSKYLLTADYTLSLNTWYHIACVWDLNAIPQMTIYINGIKQAESSPGLVDVRTNTEDLVLGFQNITSGNLSGMIDDVRLWNTARSQTRIQDTLCHKLTSSETDYAALMGNLQFNEDSGIVCNDASGQGNPGITNAARVCSTAPIGDASAHDYTGSAAAEFEVIFPSDYTDSMTVTGDGGEWNAATLDSFLQVYRVDESPEYANQPFLWKNLGSAAHYWGVFKSGGTDPSYQVVYTYTDYPGISNENALELAFRKHNCEAWKSAKATLDTAADTLTRTGLSGTEFILGQDVDPRNAIDFNGTDDYVSVADDNDLDPTTTGTIEAWINITQYQTNAGVIHKGVNNTLTDAAYSLYMDGTTGNQVRFSIYDGGTSTISGTTNLSLNTWYHIAGTWDTSNTRMTLYINGIQEGTATPSTAARNSTGALNIGVRPSGGTSNYFDGKIDEVRVWKVERSQTDIREYMCRKLAGSETGLGGYWRFDQESTSTTCPDYDFGTKNDGTMNGTMSTPSANVLAARVCSPAPIGDDSAYDYTPTTTSANLGHADGDSITASADTGTWNNTFSGLQIYRVDEAPVYPPDIATSPYAYSPNGLTPPYTFGTPSEKWSSIDYYRYWGVFVTDWTTTPTYQLVYNYSGNPSVPVDETVLGLAKRDEYCDRTWADAAATLDTTANTLTKS